EGFEQVLLGGEVVVDGRLADADRLAEVLVAHGVGPQPLDQVLGGVEDQGASVRFAHSTILSVGRQTVKGRLGNAEASGGCPTTAAHVADGSASSPAIRPVYAVRCERPPKQTSATAGCVWPAPGINTFLRPPNRVASISPSRRFGVLLSRL